MLLAIDTSTSQTGLACYDESGVLAECSWRSGRAHTAQLLPQLTLLLRHLGRAREEIAAVAVALGPGSWSGLRVGMSTAKGFALARDLPIVGIGTLDALAYQHSRLDLPVCPVVRLGRDRFATLDGPLSERHISECRNVTLAEIRAATEQPTLFCGDIDGQVRETLRAELGEQALFPSPVANARRPAYLADLAWERLQAGDTDDVAALEPIYLGHPVKSSE